MINKESEYYDDFNDEYEPLAKKTKDDYEFENELLKKFDNALASNTPKLVFQALDKLFAHDVLDEEVFLHYYKYLNSDKSYELEHFFIRAFTSCIFKDNEKSLAALYDYTEEKAKYFFDDLERQFIGSCAAKCLWMTNEYYPQLLELENHKSDNSLLFELMTLHSPSHSMRVEMLKVIFDVYASVPYKTKEILDTNVYDFNIKDSSGLALNLAMPNNHNVIKLAILQDGSKSTELLKIMLENCKKYNVSYDLNDNFYTAPLNETKNIDAVMVLVENGYDIKAHQYSFLNTLDVQWITKLYEKQFLENNEENQNTIMSMFFNRLNNMTLNSYQFKEMQNKLNIFSEQDYINLKHCDYNGNIAHQYMKIMVNYLEKTLKTNMDHEQYNNHVSVEKMLNQINPIVESFEVLKQKGIDFEQVDINQKKSVDYLKDFMSTFDSYPSYIKRNIDALQVPLEKLTFTLMLNDNKSSRKIKI